MSILGSNSSKGNVMTAPFFQEIKKQASFFLKEKIKTARLALTDVTPAQLLAEEATNGNPGGPDTRILKMISKAAFEVDDYWRVVEILHKRLANFDKINWRVAYKALIVLEHMLSHGPGSVAEEFQSDKDVIEEMGDFQYIDEKGFDWGLKVRKKSERILELLENRDLLKEERNRARKITRGIEGFGSFCERTSSGKVLQETSAKQYRRCNSQFNDHGNRGDLFSSSNNEEFALMRHEKSLPPTKVKIAESLPPTKVKTADTYSNKKIEKSSSWKIFCDENITENVSAGSTLKENKAPEDEMLVRDLDELDWTGESNALLDEKTIDSLMSISMEEEDHPFSESEHRTNASLLSAPALQAC